MAASGNQSFFENIVGSMKNVVHRFRHGPGGPADTGEIKFSEGQTIRKVSSDQPDKTERNKRPKEKPPRPTNSPSKHQESTIPQPNQMSPAKRQTKESKLLDPTKLEENTRSNKKHSETSKTCVPQENSGLAEPSTAKAGQKEDRLPQPPQEEDEKWRKRNNLHDNNTPKKPARTYTTVEERAPNPNEINSSSQLLAGPNAHPDNQQSDQKTSKHQEDLPLQSKSITAYPNQTGPKLEASEQLNDNQEDRNTHKEIEDHETNSVGKHQHGEIKHHKIASDNIILSETSLTPAIESMDHHEKVQDPNGVGRKPEVCQHPMNLIDYHEGAGKPNQNETAVNAKTEVIDKNPMDLTKNHEDPQDLGSRDSPLGNKQESNQNQIILDNTPMKSGSHHETPLHVVQAKPKEENMESISTQDGGQDPNEIVSVFVDQNPTQQGSTQDGTGGQGQNKSLSDLLHQNPIQQISTHKDGQDQNQKLPEMVDQDHKELINHQEDTQGPKQNLDVKGFKNDSDIVPPPKNTINENSITEAKIPTNEPKDSADDNKDFENTTIAKVKSIQEELSEVKKEIDEFIGTSSDDRDYLYLDELLMRYMIKFDNIQTRNIEAVRQERKKGVKAVQQMLRDLDAKLKDNQQKEETAKANCEDTENTEKVAEDGEPPGGTMG